MVETKPPHSPEGNKLNNLTNKNKYQASNPKRYICKNIHTKTQGPEL